MMVSFSSGTLSSDETDKLNGFMLKWTNRKVRGVRNLHPRCGRSVDAKAGDISASKNVDMEADGAIRNSEIRNDVLPGGDVEKGSSVAGEKSSVSGKGGDYGDVKISVVGVKSQSHESGTSIVGVNIVDFVNVPVEELIESAYSVEKSVMETGSLEMQLQNKVDGRIDETPSVLIQAEGYKSLGMMVGQVSTPVNIFSNGVDELAIEAKVKGVDLMNAVSSGSSERSTKVEGGHSMLKELNKMDGLASGHNSQFEAKPVLSGASADKILLPGPSHLQSSTYESMSDRIKLRRRKVCGVHDSPPTPRMNVSLPKKANLRGRKKKFHVEREPSLPDNNNKVRPRDNSFTAGKELDRDVLIHGLMAAPYCPWRNADNEESGVKMEQPKWKSVPVTCSPKRHSVGQSKRKAFRDLLDAEESSGSSTRLKNGDYVSFTEQPARLTPISMFTSDHDHLLGKGCNLNPSRSAFSSEYEEDEELTSGTLNKTSTRARGGEEMEKNNPSWLNRSKTVARETLCSEKKWGNKSKGEIPADSLFSGKTKDFDIRLPRLGPKNHNCGDARSRVKNTLMYFHCICRKILQKEEAFECKSKMSGKKLTRLDLAALNMIKDEGKCVNTEMQILGEVPGVEVGDEFQFRAELAVVGMHRHLQNGIDSMKHDGIPVAISIVTSGCYNDDTEHADVLIYTGQGGNVVGTNKNYEHQKLERGNLALSNSKEKGTPVRVVRGWTETVKGTDPFDSKSKLVSIYYYDGLYTVKRYWTELGSHGKLVYKFELTRNPGQPELVWKELKKACKSKVREGVCIRDISHGKESFPICAVNVTDDEKPPEFTYISKMMYPDWYRPSPPMGCDCVDRCSDSRKCGCAARNGGEIPYNRNGAIVESKPYVYECGPHCKCPPTCYNRVTQRGIKVRLEVFKTNKRGWGLRALTSVPSGTFICEYAGELLEDTEADKRIGYDEYLFDIGQNCVDSVMNYEDQTFLLRTRRKNVMYDHDDDKMPHVMLFAMENIPPFKELTYHYNYKLDQVRDSSGNVKIKECFCGSADCSGRMY